MTDTRRTGALLLAAVVIAAVLFSCFYIAAEAEHDCVGEGCVICAVLSTCESLLSGISAAVCMAVPGAAGCRLCSSIFREKYFGTAVTPVSLHVRLSD